MHTGGKEIWPLARPRPGAASRGKTFPTRLRRPVQWKFAAKAAHGPSAACLHISKPEWRQFTSAMARSF